MRFELTVRAPEDTERAAPLLREYGIGRVNVTDTAKDADALAASARLRAALPGLDVMTHSAAKHHDPHSFRSLLFRVEDDKLDPLLVVSGHPRGKFDSLAALDMMSAAGGRMRAYCAYDPFLAGGERAEAEARLERKLSHAFVRGVCLQIGLDEARIREAVARIRALRPDVAVLGSVPVPSEGMLRRLKEKPLFGMHLDAGFLASPDAAAAAAKAHLGVLRGAGIEPLYFMDSFERDRIEAALALDGAR